MPCLEGARRQVEGHLGVSEVRATFVGILILRNPTKRGLYWGSGVVGSPHIIPRIRVLGECYFRLEFLVGAPFPGGGGGGKGRGRIFFFFLWGGGEGGGGD